MHGPFSTPLLDTFVRPAEDPLSFDDQWVDAASGTGAFQTNGCACLVDPTSNSDDPENPNATWAYPFAAPVEAFVEISVPPNGTVALFCTNDTAGPWYDGLSFQLSNGATAYIIDGTNTLASGGILSGIVAGTRFGFTISATGIYTAWAQVPGEYWIAIATNSAISDPSPTLDLTEPVYIGLAYAGDPDTAGRYVNFGGGIGRP